MAPKNEKRSFSTEFKKRFRDTNFGMFLQPKTGMILSFPILKYQVIFL